MKRPNSLVACAITATLALGSSGAIADDAAALQMMRAQMAEMQRQIEAMESRLQAQDQKQSAALESVAKQQSAADNKAVRVYGRANISMDHRSSDWGSGAKGSELRSNASRLGVQGEMETKLEDMTLFYTLEASYDTTAETTSSLGLREAWAGAKGSWGSLRGGRLTVPYKQHYTVLDPWTDNVPQARSGGRQGVSELHANYFNNAVEFKTAQLGGGFRANAWFATLFDDSSNRLHNAGALVNFRGGDAYGLGMAYREGPLFVAADWLELSADQIAGGGVSNGDAWQLMGRYQVLPDLSFSLLYEDAKDLGLGQNIYTNAIYRMGDTRLIAGYGRNRDRIANSNKEWNNWSLGAKHALSRQSELFLAWNRREDATANENLDTVTMGVNIRFSQ